MRKITVFNTSGKGAQEIESEAVNWGQLQKEFSKLQKPVETNNMKAVIGENRNTLESPEAILPDGDFVLFLMPIKTKSGGMDRKDLFEKIKAYVGNDANRKALFVIDGKNMTQLKTDLLEELYNKHIKGKGGDSAPAPKPAAPTKPAPKSNVADVVKSAAKNASDKLGTTLLAKTEELSVLVEETGNDQIVESFGVFFEAVKDVFATDSEEVMQKKQQAAAAEEERLRKERKLKEKNEKLARQAQEIARGFKDVRM